MENRIGRSWSAFISAGDVSGDIHAGGLIREIARQVPDAGWYGLGGPSMKAAGCLLLEEPEREVVMGFSRVLTRIPHYFALLARIAAFLKSRRPDLVILVDYPGLNLRIARIARRYGIRVVYFICPQLWAWAPWRIGPFSRLVDLALVIFSFEEAYFTRHGVNTRYIGNPTCDRRGHDRIEGEAGTKFPEGELLALLPGSRRQEVEMNLPVMLHCASKLRGLHRGIIPVLSHFDDALLDLAGRMARDRGVELHCMRGGMRRLARAARLCLVTSGTATLEVALQGTPMVVIYRTSKLVKRLVSHLITVPYFCQVNLMAGSRLVPELNLTDDSPSLLMEQALPLLEEGQARDRLLAGLEAFRRRFDRPGAIKRAAKTILMEYGPRDFRAGHRH